MSLQDRLDAMKAASTTRIPQQTRAIMAHATDELRYSGILAKAIRVGNRLPAFELANQDGQTVRLADLLRSGPVIVSFFRGVWCPYCNAELEALEAAAEDFRNAGATLVVISPQNRASAEKTKRDRNLSFDVLVDAGNAYAGQLGIAFKLSDDLRSVYRGFKLDLPQFNGDDSWTLPMPTRLVVDLSGIVRDADINPDYTTRPDPAATLAVLHKLRAAA
jgi:peroxiredoxin